MIQPNFFEAGSPFLQHPLLTAGRTTREIDFILEQIELPAAVRLLDVGCGFGRHSLELAKRGFAVTAIDPAAAMIAAARERAAAAGVSIDFQQVAAETLDLKEMFEAAICLFTTLGQISTAGNNSGLVERAYAALKPGGAFVVEVPQRETAVSQLKPTDKFGEGERYTAVSRRYDAAGYIVTETFELISPEKRRTYCLQYRLYSRDELRSLLTAAGFTVTAMFGDYAGTPLSADSPTMVMIGRK